MVYGNSCQATTTMNEWRIYWIFTVLLVSLIEVRMSSGMLALCASQCLNQMHSITTKQSMPNFAATEMNIFDPSDIFHISVKKNSFDQFCKQTYIQFVECLDNCPRESFLENYEITLQPFNFICINSLDGILSNFDCLQRVVNECASNLCKTDFLDADAVSAKKFNVTTEDSIAAMMDEICTTTLKTGSCVSKYVNKFCAQKSGQLIVDLYKMWAEKAELQVQSYATGIKHFNTPQSCADVKHMRVSSTASTFTNCRLFILSLLFVFILNI